MEKSTEKAWKIAAAIGSLLALFGIIRAVIGGKGSAGKPVEDTVLYTI